MHFEETSMCFRKFDQVCFLFTNLKTIPRNSTIDLSWMRKNWARFLIMSSKLYSRWGSRVHHSFYFQSIIEQIPAFVDNSNDESQRSKTFFATVIFALVLFFDAITWNPHIRRLNMDWKKLTLGRNQNWLGLGSSMKTFHWLDWSENAGN